MGSARSAASALGHRRRRHGARGGREGEGEGSGGEGMEGNPREILQMTRNGNERKPNKPRFDQCFVIVFNFHRSINDPNVDTHLLVVLFCGNED